MKKDERQFLQKLQGMYAFLEDAYSGNHQFRWSETPYMKKAIRSGKNESVLGHTWSMLAMWYFLQRICPALAKVVNPNRVYELILLHDVGETQSGDIDMYRKIRGYGANKKKEREMICKMSRKFPKSSRILNEVVGTFDAFDVPIAESDSLEALVVRLIDGIQGGHYAMVYGNDLTRFSKPIEQILKMHFVPSANRLIDLLGKKRLEEARIEVVQVVLDQVKRIKQAGVGVTVKSLGLEL